MKRHLLLACTALCAFTFSTAASAEEMSPGKWEIVIANNTNGEDDGNYTMTQCMSKEDLESQVMGAAEDVPAEKKNKDYEISGEDGDCSYKMNQKGNVLHVETNCSGEVSVSDVTYSSNSFSMKSSINSEGEKTVTEMHGKRVGDC